MGILTPFFNLFKPAKTDPQAVSKLNENFDIIDTEMHKPPLTVNDIEPDAERNIYLSEVPLATNLSSDIAQLISGDFIVRTAGGSASIGSGYASLVSLKGNMIHTGYVPEALNMTVTPAPRSAPPAITASINQTVFKAYVETAGTYTLTYASAWSADPALYGVTVVNTPVSGDEIVIEWDGTNDAVMTVNAVARTVPPDITATIDREVFVAYVPDSTTITLTYSSAWSANPALYGITVTNTPVSGDTITVVYTKENRGTITPANPATFRATGWNLYDNANGYAMVVAYSDVYGYKLGGNYSLLEFAESLTGTRSSVTVTSGYFNIPADGYIFVTGGDATTYIYPTWSDWIDGYEGAFEAYTADEIDLSEVMLSFPYGLLAVGNVRDEINVNAQTAISRVERMAYTAENLAAVIASGVAYDADTNYIYAALETPVTTAISVDGTYTANDHGIEFFTGTSVPVMTETLYGENLKDKLRTDVLTISAQELTPAQKAQVQNNLGLGASATKSVANNLTTVSAGSAVLDAYQGKVLKDDLDTLNSKLSGQYIAGSEDLNTYYGSDKTGIYNIGDVAPSNCPAVWAQLFVNSIGNGATQILMTENYIYTRRHTGNPATWTSWRKQWLYDVDWVTLTKDGTNSYAKYRVRGNVVTVFAYHKVSSQTIAAWANYIFGQIPAEYRPYEDVYARIVCDRTADDGCAFIVGSNGNVYISGRYTGALETSDVLYATVTYVI